MIKKTKRFFTTFVTALSLTAASQSLLAQMNVDKELLDEWRSRPKKVYNGAVKPNWIENSEWFWYQNHTRTGDFYLLVNGRSGEKRSFPSKEELDAQIKILPKDSLITKKEVADKDADNLHDPISPDKKWRVSLKDGNLYLTDNSVDNGQTFQLTFDAAPGFSYGSFVWSPNSQYLAAIKTREVNTRRIPLIESAPKSQLQGLLQWRNYAKPGDQLPLQLPVLIDINQKKEIALDLEPYQNQYFLRFTGWRKDSRGFTFEYNQRGHQLYIVAEVSATDGKIRHLIEEKSDTFIEYNKLFRYDIDDGKEIIWISPRDGWRHLYLVDGTNGHIKHQITQGEWVVREVLEVDEKNRTIYFLGSGKSKKEDPYNLHYFKVDFDGKNLTCLTPEKGNHLLSFSPDRTCVVDVCSQPDVPPVSLLRDAKDGRILETLEKCDIEDLLKEGWQKPEPFCAVGRDGKTEIWGTIFRPSHFDPSKSYPVIEDIYAGPHDSFVNKNFSAFDWYISPLAELGFIVVKIDGMGTNNRSKAFHDVCWKNLKDAGFPDRICWMKAAAERYPYMDLSRVGIYGWSAGGQNAMAALLFHNDFYKAAVSFCGCHDNRVDKMWWNEQWKGYPIDESYSQSSNVDNAHLLKGDLLIINGELDDNVDPISSLQVVNALIKANKPFEQLYMPGRTHSLGSDYEVGRMYDFFVRKLQNKKE